MALNHSFEFLSHYLYLLGALQRISSPRRQSRIFGNAILKKFTVLYHVNFFQPVGARWKLILGYMVNNDHIKLLQKYQPSSCELAGNIAKFPFRGHPISTSGSGWDLAITLPGKKL